jgi:hypothetical protein
MWDTMNVAASLMPGGKNWLPGITDKAAIRFSWLRIYFVEIGGRSEARHGKMTTFVRESRMPHRVPRPTKFGHVVFATRRYQAMLQWYKTVFDARVQFEDAVATFLTFDDEHHRFLIANLDVALPGTTEIDRQGLVGIAHIAYTLSSLADLASHYMRLKQEGILPFWVIHHGFTISMYYGDPYCNDIEFQVDLFDTPEGATRYMRSGALETNPIGVEIDPEEFVRRIRAGTPSADFRERPAGQMSPPRSSRTDPPMRVA